MTDPERNHTVRDVIMILMKVIISRMTTIIACKVSTNIHVAFELISILSCLRISAGMLFVSMISDLRARRGLQLLCEKHDKKSKTSRVSPLSAGEAVLLFKTLDSITSCYLPTPVCVIVLVLLSDSYKMTGSYDDYERVSLF